MNDGRIAVVGDLPLSTAVMESLRRLHRDRGVTVVGSGGEVVDLREMTMPESLDSVIEHVPSPFQIIEDFNQGLERKRFSERKLQQFAAALAKEQRSARNKRKRRHRKERGK